MDSTHPCAVGGCTFGDIESADGYPICSVCGREDKNVDFEDPDCCDWCGGTGIDEDAPDDGTEDYDICRQCGGNG